MFTSIPHTLRKGTRDLPAVPPLVQYLVLRFLPAILAWLESCILRQLLLRFAHHPLVQIAQFFDLTPVIAACADYYHPADQPGKPPSFSVEVLVRAEIVRAWAECCSDRDLEWHLTSNLLVRAFVGLPLLAGAPDHSTLNRFHVWLADHHPDTLFRDVLAFLERVDPEPAATTPQIVDTFALHSPAAWAPRTANLLLDLCADLSAAWQHHAPVALQHALPPLDLGPIFHPVRPRDALERQALLAQAVSLSQRLLADLTPKLVLLPDEQRGRITRLLVALAKVLKDEIAFDATGQISERKHKGEYRIIRVSRQYAV